MKRLRRRGHDVAWVHADARGSSDPDVLATALREGRILVTFDKDFGELAFVRGLRASPGVILFRIRRLSAAFVTRIVVTANESRADWVGNFSVVEEGQIRMTPLSNREISR